MVTPTTRNGSCRSGPLAPTSSTRWARRSPSRSRSVDGSTVEICIQLIIFFQPLACLPMALEWPSWLVVLDISRQYVVVCIVIHVRWNLSLFEGVPMTSAWRLWTPVWSLTSVRMGFYMTSARLTSVWPPYDINLISVRPLSDLCMTSIYLTSVGPPSNLCVTSILSLSDLYLTAVWPLSDLYITSISPLSDLYLTSIWPLFDLYLTSIWPLSDPYPPPPASRCWLWTGL